MAPAYTYAAVVIDVHDGDTCHLDIDAGFSVHVHADVRLAHINAPELATPAGPPARDHLAGLLAGAALTVKVLGPDKYGGRWQGEITLPDGRAVSDVMVADGFAKPWGGHGPKPI